MTARAIKLGMARQVQRKVTRIPRAPSAIEERLWWVLQAEQKALRLVDLPTREHVFASPRKWRFDFAWVRRKIAVECEGGIWNGGRHTRGAGFEADCEKYNAAAIAGWRVLRVTGPMVSDGRAMAAILECLTA